MPSSGRILIGIYGLLFVMVFSISYIAYLKLFFLTLQLSPLGAGSRGSRERTVIGYRMELRSNNYNLEIVVRPRNCCQCGLNI